MADSVKSETKTGDNHVTNITSSPSSAPATTTTTSSSAPSTTASSNTTHVHDTFGNHWRMPQASTSLSDIWDMAYPLKVQNSLTRSKVSMKN